jgi:hypothetical protein
MAKATRETFRHREAFEAWYSVNRNWSKTAQNSAVSRRLLYDWAERYDWHERADRRDREAQRIADDVATVALAQRIEAQRKAGTALRLRGMEYLSKHGITNARDAITAVKIGIEIERQADTLPDWVFAILSADAAQLETYRQQLEAQFMARREAAQLTDGD